MVGHRWYPWGARCGGAGDRIPRSAGDRIPRSAGSHAGDCLVFPTPTATAGPSAEWNWRPSPMVIASPEGPKPSPRPRTRLGGSRSAWGHSPPHPRHLPLGEGEGRRPRPSSPTTGDLLPDGSRRRSLPLEGGGKGWGSACANRAASLHAGRARVAFRTRQHRAQQTVDRGVHRHFERGIARQPDDRSAERLELEPAAVGHVTLE